MQTNCHPRSIPFLLTPLWATFAFFCLVGVLFVATPVCAVEAVFQIQEFDNDTQEFTLKSYGQVPEGSYVEFWNEFGAVRGNRYNQIPRNTKAEMFLVGWEGCRIDSITLAMCSNKSSGSARLVVETVDSETSSTVTNTLFTMPTADFCDSLWYGEWLSKDVVTYADITKVMQAQHIITEDEDLRLTLKGGTAEGSVYLYRVTVHYTPLPMVPLVSPMGYVYQKLDRKATLAEGDTLILYRSGAAASDIDGMELSHYLDATVLASVSNVYEPSVCHFVLHRNGTAWQLVTLYGDTLGAAGERDLQWNAGVTTWDITLDYDGAIISSTRPSYGTLRYNAPVGSYARFWNYTSTSLTLPYLYRRVRQNQPILATSLTLPSARIAYLDTLTHSPLAEQSTLQADTLVLHAALLPKAATDERLRWTSSVPEVASVRDGIVHLHALGQTTITCSTWDGSLSTTCLIDVLAAPIESSLENCWDQKPAPHLVFRNGEIYIEQDGQLYSLTGQPL